PTSVHIGLGTYDNAVIRGRAGFHYNLAEDKGIWASASAARSDGTSVAVPLIGDGGAPMERVARSVDAFTSSGTAGRVWWGPFTLQWFYHRRDQTIPVGAYATIVNDPRTAFNDTRMMAEARFEPRLTNNVEMLVRAHANRYLFEAVYAFETEQNRE